MQDENNTWDRTTVEKTLIDSIIIDLTECELSEEIEIRLDQREINECPVRVMEIRRRELPELWAGSTCVYMIKSDSVEFHACIKISDNERIMCAYMSKQMYWNDWHSKIIQTHF